jgi:hypothetical protein
MFTTAAQLLDLTDSKSVLDGRAIEEVADR